MSNISKYLAVIAGIASLAVGGVWATASSASLPTHGKKQTPRKHRRHRKPTRCTKAAPVHRHASVGHKSVAKSPTPRRHRKAAKPAKCPAVKRKPTSAPAAPVGAGTGVLTASVASVSPVAGVPPEPAPPAEVPAPPAPSASFSYAPVSPVVGEEITLDGTSSACQETPCRYEWSDDGSPSRPLPPLWPLGTGPTLRFTFVEAGTKYIRLVVTDALGRSATVEHDVVVAPGEAGGAPPENTVQPSVSGEAVEGSTLVASSGSWTGAPTSFSYRWEDCSIVGHACSNIAGATAATYVLASSDVGHTVRVVVTAKNAEGSTSASSAVTTTVLARTPAAPVNTSLPTIAGSTVEGQTLAAGNGSWSGGPTSFSYQWRDCNGSGSSCVNVGGATSSSYKLGSGDVGHTIRVVVTATSAGGSTPATSAATAVVEAAAVAPPVNTSLPTIAGSTVEGQTLAAGNGSWSGGPTSFSYQWRDCNGSGSSCVNVGGATSSSYKLGSGDVGHTIRVVVTATSAGGSTPATSAATAVVEAAAVAPPVNTSLPTIAGSTVEGQTLAAGNGSWSGGPTSFSYQWRDCNGSGSSCVNVGGATSSSYKLGSGDVGHTIRVVVTATSAGGSTPATSAATAVVEAAAVAPPVNTSLPTIAGSTVEGQTLAAGNGSWSGGPTSFSYQWRDCNGSGSSCVNVGGATSSSYKLGSGDVGHTIRVVVTATNAGGSTPATSAATAVVTSSGSLQAGCFQNPGEEAKETSRIEACGYPGYNNTGPEPSVLPLKEDARWGSPGHLVVLTIVGAGECASPGVWTNNCGEQLATTQAIEGRRIYGEVKIRPTSKGAVIKNDEIIATGESGNAVKNEDGENAVVTHSALRGLERRGPNHLHECAETNAANKFTITYSRILDCDGIKMNNGAVVENNYCVDSVEIPGEHYECLSDDCSSSAAMEPLKVRHNTFFNPHKQTSAIFVQGTWGLCGEIAIEENFLAGGDETLSAGLETTGPVHINNNRFAFASCASGEKMIAGGNWLCKEQEPWSGHEEEFTPLTPGGTGYYPNSGSYRYASHVIKGTHPTGNFRDDNLAVVSFTEE